MLDHDVHQFLFVDPATIGESGEDWAPGNWFASCSPSYSGSLEACLKMAKRVRPDHFPGVQETPMGWGAELAYPEPRRDRLGKHFAICSDSNWFPSPALALLCVVLRSVEANGLSRPTLEEEES